MNFQLFQSTREDAKMANCIVIDIVNHYYVIIGKYLANLFYFIFFSLKYGVRMRVREEGQNTQVSEDEWLG